MHMNEAMLAPVPTAQTTLDDLLAMYVDARNAERPINAPLSDGTFKHYFWTVRSFTKFLRRKVRVADLNAENTNRFLRSLAINGNSDYGVKSRRTGLLALWRFAAKLGLTVPPTGVQTVRVNPLSVEGYDVSAIVKLVEQA